MSDHECDGPDCCLAESLRQFADAINEASPLTIEPLIIDDPDHKPTFDVQVESHGDKEPPIEPITWYRLDISLPGSECLAFRIPSPGSDRLAFLETRRVELQEMCARRSRELIEARERIAFLERCLGRLVAEREANGIRS